MASRALVQQRAAVETAKGYASDERGKAMAWTAERRKLGLTLLVASFGVYSAIVAARAGYWPAAVAVLLLVGLQLWRAPWDGS